MSAKLTCLLLTYTSNWEPYFSVIHVKYVYSTPCCMVNASDLIFGIYACMHPQYMPNIFLIYSIQVVPNYPSSQLNQMSALAGFLSKKFFFSYINKCKNSLISWVFFSV